MSYMLNGLLTPQQRAQADAADAAMRIIDSKRAERATLNSAGQAIECAITTAAGSAAWAKKWPALTPQESAAFIADMPNAKAAALAIQPRDVSQRHCYDADLGSFNAHPADPRMQPNELVGDMLEQINCAERALAMARQALEGVGYQVSTVAARQQMTEARDFLAVPR